MGLKNNIVQSFFVYKADKQRYGKIFNQMENDMLQKRKVKVCHILGDRQFESIRNDMEPRGIMVNTTRRDENF